MIRLLVVDDGLSFCRPLTIMLEWERYMSVIAQADTLAGVCEALEGLGDGIVGLALLDLILPEGLGAEPIGDLHAANLRAQALVLTSYSDREQHSRAVEAGAAGVLNNKAASTEEIVEGISRLYSGEQLLPAAKVLEDDPLRCVDARAGPRGQIGARAVHAMRAGSLVGFGRRPGQQGVRQAPPHRPRHRAPTCRRSSSSSVYIRGCGARVRAAARWS